MTTYMQREKESKKEENESERLLERKKWREWEKERIKERDRVRERERENQKELKRERLQERNNEIEWDWSKVSISSQRWFCGRTRSVRDTNMEIGKKNLNFYF